MNDLLNVNSNTKLVIKRKNNKRKGLDLDNLSSFSQYKIVKPYFNNTSTGKLTRYNLSELRRNFKLLESFKKLEKNWNDNNAPAFSEKLVNRVFKIIRDLEYQPQIFPTGRNSIQIEFESKNEDYLEFEIFNEKIVSFREFQNEEEGKEIGEQQVLLYVKEFYA